MSRANLDRYLAWTKWISIAVMVIALVLIVRKLPVSEGVRAMQGWIQARGALGPMVFALIYVAATVLFIPGSVLTLAAGAIFGLWIGTLAVSVGSTVGAACAFLMARYLARRKLARKIERYPKFSAIDRAVGAQGGWKIVAMLRLSPAVPFNLQNYLYGLTSIGFRECVLTSWIAMLPGTFMYVYLGYIGKEAALAAADGGAADDASANTWKTVLLIVGLIATVAATAYITRLARRAIRQGTDIDAARANMEQTVPTDRDREPARPRAWSAVTAVILAILAVGGASYAGANPLAIANAVRGLLGQPPKVNLVEVYAAEAGGPTFDHSLYEELVRKYVNEDGWVDYAGLNEDAARLNRYLASLAQAPFDQMGRDEKLAMLLNAYNAFTLRLILDHWDGGKLRSITDISTAKRWQDRRWRIGGHVWSLDDIEHEQIRPRFNEPRIHFALVCAAVGCPPLRHEAYTAARVNDQLEAQARYVHGHERWFQYDPETNVVYLTRLYDWYGDDFQQTAGSVLQFAARYSPPLAKALEDGRKLQVQWLDYDWRLNRRDNAAPPTGNNP